MRHKRYYATRYTDEKRFYSQRDANRADTEAREKQEEADKKARRRKNVLRQRREAEEKAKSPEVLAAKAEAAAIRATEESVVRGVTAERDALNLNTKEYYERFITPLIDNMAEGISGGDAMKKSAYIKGAEFVLGTNDTANAEKFKNAVGNNRYFGDQKFIGELGYYIGTNKNNFEARQHLAVSIMPAVNEALDRVVSEGLFTDRAAATEVLGFKGWLATPFVGADYQERNRLERRFRSGDTVKPWDLGTVAEMAAKVDADPVAFKEALYKGLKESAQHVRDANRIFDIRSEEENAAFAKGWFASERATQSAASAIAHRPEIRDVHKAAANLAQTSVGFDGVVEFDSAANDAVQRVLADPEVFRAAIRSGLAQENAKIFAAVDVAEAYTKAAAMVTDTEGAKASVVQSLNDIKAQGVFKQLLSPFKLVSLHAESKSLDGDLEQARATTSEIRKGFDVARRAADNYVGMHATPEHVVGFTQNMTRAPQPVV